MVISVKGLLSASLLGLAVTPAWRVGKTEGQKCSLHRGAGRFVTVPTFMVFNSY